MLGKALCVGALVCAATFARADDRSEAMSVLAAGVGAQSVCGITLTPETKGLMALWAMAKGVDIRDEAIQREVRLRFFILLAQTDSAREATATLCNTLRSLGR